MLENGGEVNVDSVYYYFKTAYTELDKIATSNYKAIIEFKNKKEKKTSDVFLSFLTNAHEYCLAAGLLPLIRAWEGDWSDGVYVSCQTDVDFHYWLCRFLAHYKLYKGGNQNCIQHILKLFKSPNNISGMTYGIEVVEGDEQSYINSVSQLMFQTAIDNLLKKEV